MKRRLVACGCDYLRKHADAERRLKRGEQQEQCPNCRLWFWPDEKHKCNGWNGTSFPGYLEGGDEG